MPERCQSLAQAQMVEQNPALVINWGWRWFPCRAAGPGAPCGRRFPQICSWAAWRDWDLQIPNKAWLSRSELIYWVPSYINIWVNCHVLGDKGCFVWHHPVTKAVTFLLDPGNSNLRAGWGPYGRVVIGLWEFQIKLVRLLPRTVFWISLNPFSKKKKKRSAGSSLM